MARRLGWRGKLQARTDELEGRLLRDVHAVSAAAMAVFERAGVEAALADDHAMRNTQQLSVRELDPGTGIAIVIQYLDAGSAELGIERLGRCPNPWRLLQIERHQVHGERRDRIRPDDSTLIVILLDRGRDDARYTN